MDIWNPITALGGLATAVFTAWTAVVARSAGDRSNAATSRANAAAERSTMAATKLTEIESQRRHSELCPRLRVSCESWNSGADTLRLRVALVGPPGLDRLDSLTISIRNDHFLRGEGQHMDGPTADDIKQHIWGPYRFTPGTGPGNDARADPTGRTTVFEDELPIGEELPYQLERTFPGRWMRSMSQEDWLRQQGTVVRLRVIAKHEEHGTWHLPCEIDTATLPARAFVPENQGAE